MASFGRENNMGCKIGEWDFFQGNGGEYWIRCIHCFKYPNIYDREIKLEKPIVFGAGTDHPVSATHKAKVKCKCGKTVFWVLGNIERQRGFACTMGHDG